MTFDQLINAVTAALAPRVIAEGGVLEVAESLEQARSFLGSPPNRWRLILHWEGYGDHEAARQGMTSHQVATVIQQPRGLTHKPGENLTNPLPSGAMPLSWRLAQVVAWMMALRFPDGTGADSAGFALSGSQWLETVPTAAAHALNWRLDAALPAFAQTIPLSFPHLTT